jgi:tetratricopeptide (TPR) repeat protein
MPTHAFVSYAREDLVWAREQARILRSGDIEVYLDVESNRAGDDWEQRILQTLERTDQVHLGWSRYSARSEWVRREYTRALELAAANGKERFLRITRLDSTDLPPELMRIEVKEWVSVEIKRDRLLVEMYRNLPDPPVPPSYLLRPEYRVSRFIGRKKVLEELMAWCNAEGLFDLFVVVGPGGTGKTRLFAELCATLAKTGWETGFLHRENMAAALNAAPGKIDAMLNGRVPTLVVIDYADSRREEVGAILSRGLERSTGRPLRVALLARNADAWWRELIQSDYQLIRLAQIRRPKRIGPLAADYKQRTAMYKNALRAYSRVLGRSPPETEREKLADPSLAHALFLHMAALLEVMDGPAANPGEPTVDISDFLNHEERYWKRVAGNMNLEPRLYPLLAPAVAILTLVGGVKDGDELEALLARHAPFADQPTLDRQAVVDVVSRVYGWEDRIEPLQPDRVGEGLVAKVLEKNKALRVGWHLGASPEQLRRGLVVIGRIAAVSEDARGWLREQLAEHPRALASAAMAVALEARAVQHALIEVFRQHLDPELALELEDRLPAESVVSRELAVIVTEAALKAPLTRPEQAAMLNSLAERLRLWGRSDIALPRALEAAEIRRTLAESNKARFLPRLATSLNTLAQIYGDTGDHQRAIDAAAEAVAIRRKLLQDDPAEYLPRLATSLNNLHIQLRDAGRYAEAVAAGEESRDIRQKLAGQQPNEYRPQLAVTLNSLAKTYIKLGKFALALDNARTSTRIRRELAGENPDAHLHRLCESLETLEEVYLGLSHKDWLKTLHEEIAVLERLVKEEPNMFRDRLQAAKERMKGARGRLNTP